MAFSVYHGVSGIFDCIPKQKTGYFLLGTGVTVGIKYPYTISASGPKGPTPPLPARRASRPEGRDCGVRNADLKEKRILFKNAGRNAVTRSFLLLHLGRSFTDR